MKSNTSTVCVLSAALFTASSFAQAPSTVVTPAPTAKTEVGVSSRDGITRSGDEALVTRNGITEKLTKQLELPNGMRVQPDGTILTRDGGTLTLRATQVLTFEGELLDAPIRESAAPKTTTTTTVTTGAAAPTTPTIVVEKPALTQQAADEAARVEAQRRANAVNKGPIKAGEGVQK